MNSLLPGDAAAHDWYRFVLSFPPHLVRDYVERFDLTDSDTVLDPFCGTGTTLVECKKLGIPSIGVEALPSSAFAANTKVGWSVDPGKLMKHAHAAAEAVIGTLGAQGIADEPINDAANVMHLRTLPEDAAKLMFKDAISPLPLHKVLVLVEELKQRWSEDYSDHEMLALASAIVGDISNLKFGPEVGVGKIKHDARVVSAWLSRVEKIASDLSLLTDSDTLSQVHVGDARRVDEIFRSEFCRRSDYFTSVSE